MLTCKIDVIFRQRLKWCPRYCFILFYKIIRQFVFFFSRSFGDPKNGRELHMFGYSGSRQQFTVLELPSVICRPITMISDTLSSSIPLMSEFLCGLLIVVDNNFWGLDLHTIHSDRTGRNLIANTFGALYIPVYIGPWHGNVIPGIHIAYNRSTMGGKFYDTQVFISLFL